MGTCTVACRADGEGSAWDLRIAIEDDQACGCGKLPYKVEEWLGCFAEPSSEGCGIIVWSPVGYQKFMIAHLTKDTMPYAICESTGGTIPAPYCTYECTLH